MKPLINSHKGQSLIEIVVAVGIIAVVLVGVSDLITRALSLASFQASKNEAVNIAQSQLNHFRQEKELNSSLFFNASLGNPAANFSTCVPGYNEEKYSCEINYYDLGSTNGTNMKVSITWKNGDNEIITELSQTLAKPTR